MSRNIRGYDVMMSTGDVLRAVVANDQDTFHPESANKISAVFGENAGSKWGHAKTVNAKDLIEANVSLPRLHSSAELTRHQADTFVGFGLHELSKACFTDRNTWLRGESDSNKMFSEVFKSLESVRAERAMLKNGMAPNARKTFESVSDTMYAQQMLQGYNPNDLSWLPSTISYLAQRRAGYNLPFADDIRRSMNPDNVKIIDDALDLMEQSQRVGRDATKDSWDAAELVMKRLNQPPSAGDGKGEGEGGGGEGKDKKKGSKGKGQGQQGQGKGNGESDGSGSEGGGEEGQGNGQDGDGSGSGDGDEGDGSSSGDGAGAGDQGDAGGKDGGGSGDQQGSGKSDGNGDGEGNRSGGKPGWGNQPATGKGGKGYSPPRWHKETLKDTRPKPLRYDEVVSKAASDINKVAKSAFGEDKLKKIRMTDENRVVEQYEATDAVLHNIRSRIPANLGSMRHALWRLLQSKDEHIVDRFQEYGRWDQRALPRMLAGQQSLYKQEGDVIGMKTCVSIILDISGSMSGEKIYSAAAACIALAETMEQLAAHGVSYEIIAFSDADYTQNMAQEERDNTPRLGGGRLPDSKKSKKRKTKWWKFDDDDGDDYGFSDFGAGGSWRKAWRGFGSSFGSYVSFSGGNQVGIIQFKGFHEKLTNRKRHIAQMVGRVNGGTPDSQGLLIAIKDVIARPEPNKIVLVITDGMGDVHGIRAGCAFAEQIGVDVIGLGIGQGSEYVREVYPNALFAPSIRRLGEAAFQAIVQQIEKNRRKYFGKGLHGKRAA